MITLFPILALPKKSRVFLLFPQYLSTKMAGEKKKYPLARYKPVQQLLLRGFLKMPLTLWFLEIHYVVGAETAYVVQYC